MKHRSRTLQYFVTTISLLTLHTKRDISCALILHLLSNTIECSCKRNEAWAAACATGQLNASCQQKTSHLLAHYLLLPVNPEAKPTLQSRLVAQLKVPRKMLHATLK
eukprot:scaffold24724_cov67-Skeletonema_dohrnii-CCMP3373.AAC.1